MRAATSPRAVALAMASHAHGAGSSSDDQSSAGDGDASGGGSRGGGRSRRASGRGDADTLDSRPVGSGAPARQLYDIAKLHEDGCVISAGDVFSKKGWKMCGVNNQHERPCQRIGKCPFHQQRRPVCKENSINGYVDDHGSAPRPEDRRKGREGGGDGGGGGGGGGGDGRSDDGRRGGSSDDRHHASAFGGARGRQDSGSGGYGGDRDSRRPHGGEEPGRGGSRGDRGGSGARGRGKGQPVPLPLPPRQAYKKGWSKDEHYLFLYGLTQYGKGNWKQIASFVRTRTPTQIQSHAQKYFLRQKASKKDKKSIHDITLDSDEMHRFVDAFTARERAVGAAFGPTSLSAPASAGVTYAWSPLNQYGSSPGVSQTPSRSPSPQPGIHAARLQQHHDPHSFYNLSPASAAVAAAAAAGTHGAHHSAHGDHDRMSPQPVLAAGSVAATSLAAYPPSIGDPLGSAGAGPGVSPFQSPGLASAFKTCHNAAVASASPSPVGSTAMRGPSPLGTPRPGEVLPPSAAVLGATPGISPTFVYNPEEAAKVKARIAKSSGASVGSTTRAASFPYSSTTAAPSPLHTTMYRTPHGAHAHLKHDPHDSRAVPAAGRQREPSPDSRQQSGDTQHRLAQLPQSHEQHAAHHVHAMLPAQPTALPISQLASTSLHGSAPAQHPQHERQYHRQHQQQQHHPDDQYEQPDLSRQGTAHPHQVLLAQQERRASLPAFEMKMGQPAPNIESNESGQADPHHPHHQDYLNSHSQRLASQQANPIPPPSHASGPSPGNTMSLRSAYQTPSSSYQPTTSAMPMSISTAPPSDGRSWPSREGDLAGEESPSVVGGVLAGATAHHHHVQAAGPFGGQGGHHPALAPGAFEGTTHTSGYFVGDMMSAADLGRRETTERFSEHGHQQQQRVHPHEYGGQQAEHFEHPHLRAQQHALPAHHEDAQPEHVGGMPHLAQHLSAHHPPGR